MKKFENLHKNSKLYVLDLVAQYVHIWVVNKTEKVNEYVRITTENNKELFFIENLEFDSKYLDERQVIVSPNKEIIIKNLETIKSSIDAQIYKLNKLC